MSGGRVEVVSAPAVRAEHLATASFPPRERFDAREQPNLTACERAAGESYEFHGAHTTRPSGLPKPLQRRTAVIVGVRGRAGRRARSARRIGVNVAFMDVDRTDARFARRCAAREA